MNYLTLLVVWCSLLLAAPAFAQDDAPLVDAPLVDAPLEAPATVEPATDTIVLADEAACGAVEPSEAPKAPETDEEALGTAVLLVDALKGKQWPLAVGLLLSLLVYGVNRFGLKDAVGEKVIPWVAFLAGTAGAVATGLISGATVLESVIAGVLASVAAEGGWSMVLKHLAGKASDSAAA